MHIYNKRKSAFHTLCNRNKLQVHRDAAQPCLQQSTLYAGGSLQQTGGTGSKWNLLRFNMGEVKVDVSPETSQQI